MFLAFGKLVYAASSCVLCLISAARRQIKKNLNDDEQEKKKSAGVKLLGAPSTLGLKGEAPAWPAKGNAKLLRYTVDALIHLCLWACLFLNLTE